MNPGIPLLGGGIALVDDEDYDRVMAAAEPTWRHHQMRHVMYASTGHRQRTMHRVVLRLDMGGPAVDHINGDGLDNRKANLRLATNPQNQMNARKHGANATSSYKGVRLHEGKWQARIKINGAQSNLGHFDTPEVAADAYDLAALKAFGRYARLNRDERIAEAHDADVARRAVEDALSVERIVKALWDNSEYAADMPWVANAAMQRLYSDWAAALRAALLEGTKNEVKS
jgi:hypothetical protein